LPYKPRRSSSYTVLRAKGKVIGRKITKGEKMAKAMGTTQVLKASQKLGVSPYYWNIFKNKYKVAEWDPWDYYYSWHPNRGLVCLDKRGEIIFTIDVSDDPQLKGLKGDALARAYAEKRAEEAAKSPEVSDTRVVKTLTGYRVEELVSPVNRFLRDVRAGKVKLRGLKLSVAQVKGLPPESGYLQAVLGGKLPPESEGYRPGLVIKITGDYDEDLKDYHNAWAVITEVIDPWHYKVVVEGSGDELIIRDTDVKAWIGDEKTDYRGLGEERHRTEVVPLIRQAMQGKIPFVVPKHRVIENPVRSAWAEGKTLQQAIKDARKELKELERKRKRYDPDAYKFLKEEAERRLKTLEEASKVDLGTADFIIEDEKGNVKWIPVRVIQIEKGRTWVDERWFGVDSKGKILSVTGWGVRAFKEGRDYRSYQRAEPPTLT